MPVTVENSDIDELTRITLTGEVSFPDFIQALNAYGAGGPTRLELYDVRGLEGERFSNADIDLLIDYFRRHPNRRPAQGKTAIVLSQTVDLGLTRMVSLLSDGIVNFEIEAFESISEAMDWLLEK